MLSAHILLISTLALLANTQTPTTDAAVPTITPSAVLPSFTPGVFPDFTPTAALHQYLASIKTQPEFLSVDEAVASAMPADVKNHPYYISWPLVGTAPSWFSAIPSSYVSYISSVRMAEWSIITEAAGKQVSTEVDEESVATIIAEGPAPTNGPPVKAVGAALAVGAAGLAIL